MSANEAMRFCKERESEMAEEKKDQELAYCPNCSGPAIRKGKLITCQTCNASFRFTPEGPKVAELGPFDELQDRVTRLEGLLGDESPDPPVAVPVEDQTKPGVEQYEEEDEI